MYLDIPSACNPTRPLQLKPAPGAAAADLLVVDGHNPQLFAATIAEQGVDLPWTCRQETGRSGFHLLFAAVAG